MKESLAVRLLKPLFKSRPWRAFEARLDGHVSFKALGHDVVVYGFNAMHVAVNVRTRRGWLCFKPPTFCYGCYWPGYVYLSPDATPDDALWGFGEDFHRRRCR